MIQLERDGRRAKDWRVEAQMRITRSAIAVAGVMTAAAVILGYVALGALPMFLFAFGFCGGFLWWLYVPSRATFSWIRMPYFLTLALFVAHKWEERVYGFFPALSDITGVRSRRLIPPSLSLCTRSRLRGFLSHTYCGTGMNSATTWYRHSSCRWEQRSSPISPFRC